MVDDGRPFECGLGIVPTGRDFASLNGLNCGVADALLRAVAPSFAGGVSDEDEVGDPSAPCSGLAREEEKEQEEEEGSEEIGKVIP